MSDLQAVYRAAVEAAPECLDGDFASVERMVDAALATLGPLYRPASDVPHVSMEDWAVVKRGYLVKVWPNELGRKPYTKPELRGPFPMHEGVRRAD